VLSILIYLPHNLKFLESVGLDQEMILSVFNYDASWFFRWFMIPYMFVAFLMAFILGPALISSDLRNNGLPLYLARSFGRWEYILGKTAVMVILLSLITWVPGLLLFAFQAYMASGWLADNLRVGVAIFLTSWIWILVLCLICLSLSAYVKWKPVARLGLLMVFFVASALGALVNVIFKTVWGSLLNISDMVATVASTLFGVGNPTEVHPAAAWLSLLGVCAFCLWLLHRKVTAYEVVRS
jgi:ABC-2 type transport system permease protein